MRIVIFSLIVLMTCSAQTCIPPANDPDNGPMNGGEDNDPNNDGSNGDGSGGSGEGLCFAGVFECEIGPETVNCGEWELEVNESNAIAGAGVITNGLGSAMADLTLSGLYLTSTRTLSVDLMADNGNGTMFLADVNTGEPVAGEFEYVHQPGPDAQSLEGMSAGQPCVR